jgi:type III pantothenate kinase
MILLLDIGNTRVKWRTLSARGIEDRGAGSKFDLAAMFADIGSRHQPQNVWVSSVADPEFEQSLQQQIEDLWQLKVWFARTQATALGLQNSYDEPGLMGVDRWLAMLAAWKRELAAVCVVDAGSALTIDFVGVSGEHLGGYILPGLDSMERALLRDTDRVRFGEAPRDQLELGRSTEAAVYNGLLLSQAGSVSLALQRTRGNFRLLFTGGNAEVLHHCLRLGGEVVDNLVLDGLFLLGDEQAGHWGAE